MATLKKTENLFSRPIIAQRRSNVFQNAPMEHSAILSTFIKLPFVIKIFVLSIFEGPFYTGLTVPIYTFLVLLRKLANIPKNMTFTFDLSLK